MKGQFSRLTARRARRYSSVRLQQGRVHLDSDFNEQVDIAAWRDRVTTRDVIGPSGAPVEDGGFGLHAVVSLTGLDGAASVFRAVGTRGTVLVTQDGGSTWALQAVPAPAAEHDLTAIDQLTNKNSMAVTTAGEVLVQSNANAWVVVTPPDAGGLPLLGVHLLTPSTAWVVGSDGRILGSVDGGGTWTRKTAAGVSETLRAVHFPTANDGWAVGDGGRVVRTADGGATWAAQSHADRGRPRRSAASASRPTRCTAGRSAMAPPSSRRLTAGPRGSRGPLRRGRTRRSARSMPSAPRPRGPWATASTILRTTDGGATWEVIAPDSTFAGADLTAVRASAANAARVAGDRSVLASVTRGGRRADVAGRDGPAGARPRHRCRSVLRRRDPRRERSAGPLPGPAGPCRRQPARRRHLPRLPRRLDAPPHGPRAARAARGRPRRPRHRDPNPDRLAGPDRPDRAGTDSNLRRHARWLDPSRRTQWPPPRAWCPDTGLYRRLPRARRRRLPPSGEPALPGRDPCARRRRHRDLQVVPRQRLGGGTAHRDRSCRRGEDGHHRGSGQSARRRLRGSGLDRADRRPPRAGR